MDLSNAETRHVKKDGAEYLEFTAFDKYKDKITAVFAIKGENDLRYFTEDGKENLENLCRVISVDPNKLIKITKQAHGDNVAVVKDLSEVAEADGLITKEKGITLSTRVADCISVLIYDPVQNAIADVHSGWRGTLKRIAPKAVLKMQQEYGTNPADVICVLCPSIGLDHFEVDDDVKDLFVEEFGERYMYGLNGKTYIDAARHLTESLVEIGVKLQNVHDAGLCTVCNKELLHSYRGIGSKEPCYHNAALICLK